MVWKPLEEGGSPGGGKERGSREEGGKGAWEEGGKGAPRRREGRGLGGGREGPWEEGGKGAPRRREGREPPGGGREKGPGGGLKCIAQATYVGTQQLLVQLLTTLRALVTWFVPHQPQ